MSYATSTTLFDNTDSERIPRDLPRTVVDIREPVATRFTTPRIPERDERFLIDYGRSYDRPWCLGRLSPVARNTRKSKARHKARATTRHENGDGDRAAADEIAYVAYNYVMDNLTDTRSRGQGVILGSSSRPDLGCDTHN